MSAFFRILLMLACLQISAFATDLIDKKKTVSPSEQEKIVVRLLDEVWSKGNLDVVDELVAPQYTIRHDPGDPWEGKTIDLATFKERLQNSRQIFPDQQFRIDEILSTEDRVAVSWHFTGTQQEDVPNFPATDEKVQVCGLTIYYLAGDKIIGHWQVFDKLGLIQQLKK
jgi:steroid delta-isomerase-like uncharacterized protein